MRTDAPVPTTPPRRTTHALGARLWAALAGVGVAVATLVLPAAPASADVTFNQRMLELINRDRVANNLSPVVADPTLGGEAEDAPYSGCGFTVAGRAMDMGQRNYFSHTILGCGVQGVFNILDSTGLVYSGAGENIAWMNATTDPLVAAENLHNQLMNSSGHRANILNPNFNSVGVGSWHTAPGQTWSGGGVTVGNVYIGVEIFANEPSAGGGGTTTDPAGRFTPLTPARIFDTRDGTGGISGPVGPGATADVQVTGRGGIPASDVSAVAMTVTVTQPTSTGFVTVWPSGAARPLASNLNFGPGGSPSNLVVVKTGSNGRVSVFNSAGTSHVIVDVAGWYSGTGTGNAGRFQPLVPARILDTRTGAGGGARLGPGASLDVQVTGAGGVPASGVQAAAVNLTVTGTTAASFVTAYPAGEARPLASNLTFGAGSTIATRAMVKLGAGGRVTIYNSFGAADVIVDVSGWYTDSSVAGTLGALVPVTPARILDTRDGTGGFGGPVPASGTVDVQVSGRGGVPASGARAVILNLTVTQPAGPGYVTAFPTGVALPLASDVDFGTGETLPNLVVVKLGTGGKVSVFTSAATHLVVDVAAWIS
jgi:uncharacterized protein YkwD